MKEAVDSYAKYLFHEGTNYHTYKLFSPKKGEIDGVQGYQFALWAPHARSVSVVGDFNNWDRTRDPMEKVDDEIWVKFIPAIKQYDAYKFSVEQCDGKIVNKIDPYAFHFETPPATASKIYDIEEYRWKDNKWMTDREHYNPYASPMNIYELHLGSWKLQPNGDVYGYKDIADELIKYVKKMGYTHVELMPVTEYPFEGSWGYQVTGMFAPTSRYGTPADLMELIDRCHRAGIGVILDWVLAHFPRDEHGLATFDGTTMYEYEDPRKGEHKEWGTKVYDFGKNEVKSFLISSAMFWFEEYHIDGIRCDAVASMLYLDYGRRAGEWIANKDGGNYNLEARDFLKQMNTALLTKNHGVITIAEESTAYPMVTKPAYDGGLGFNFKWNMGWMNDSLHYLALDPFFRKDNHKDLTFAITYAYSENYILPLSHDEVVHGKASMLSKVPGDYDEKFEGLKAFFGYHMAHPGKKLTFMGAEFGQFIEWNYKQELDWFLLEYDKHRQLQKFVKDLNQFYLENKAMWEMDCSYEGFKWIVVDDNTQNIISFIRSAADDEKIICIINFSPVTREKYVMGVPEYGTYKTELISSLNKYGGNTDRRATYKATKKTSHGYPYSIKVDIQKNSCMFLKIEKTKGEK